MFTLILTNYLILWCIFSILLNWYGDYLLERFKLEDKYPRIALFIKYRRRLSRYYIVSNFIIIILTNLMTIIYAIAVLLIVS
jgi:hypothetical protein